MDDARIVELYCQSQELGKTLAQGSQFAEFVDLPVAHGWFDSREGFLTVADQDLQDLANFVNEFIMHVNVLAAWHSMLPSIAEDELMPVVVQFIHPAAYFCLAVPQAFKGRLHYSIARVSHLANEFVVPGWKHIPDLGNSDADKAKEHASRWQSWPRLKACLGQLDSRGFRRAVKGFRNEFHHGSPVEILVGDKSFVHRRDGVTVFGVMRPLGLGNVVTALQLQQRAAAAAFQAYLALVREQVPAVMTSKLIPRTRQVKKWCQDNCPNEGRHSV